MKPIASILRTSLAGLLVLACAPNLAQPSGLRLLGGSEGILLRESDNGLRLRLSSQSTPATALAMPMTDGGLLTRNTLRADWPVFGYGLRTSLGVSWNSPEASMVQTASAPSTFLGLGWRSEPLSSRRIHLSAELGASLSSQPGGCSSYGQSCSPSRPLGLSPEASGSGLRLSPYISFGATLNY